MVNTFVDAEKFYKDLKVFINEGYEELNFNDKNIAEIREDDYTEGTYCYVDPYDNSRTNGKYYIEVVGDLDSGGLEVIIRVMSKDDFDNEEIYYYDGNDFELE